MKTLLIQLGEHSYDLDRGADLRAAKVTEGWMVVDVSQMGGSTDNDGDSLDPEDANIIAGPFDTEREAKFFIHQATLAIENTVSSLESISVRLKALSEHVVKSRKLIQECAGYARHSGEKRLSTEFNKEISDTYKYLLKQQEKITHIKKNIDLALGVF